jgi:L-alanine-DL-glutamate epimerase-like enolase superfamily enzyme
MRLRHGRSRKHRIGGGASPHQYTPPIAVGEALFSLAEANLLDAHGGLRRERDILEFDPVHRYGLPGYLKIVAHLSRKGWPRHAFRPHGGHPFGLQVVAALGPVELRLIRTFPPFAGWPIPRR